MRRPTLVLVLTLALLAPLVAPGAARAAVPTCGGLTATKWKPDAVVNGVAQFNGTTGRDVIVGTIGPDAISTAAPNGNDDAGDYVCGRGGNDRINTYAGPDRVWAGAGDDDVYTGPGADVVRGGPGVDELGGQGGNDVLHGGSENDLLDGQDGDDTLLGQDGND